MRAISTARASSHRFWQCQQHQSTKSSSTWSLLQRAHFASINNNDKEKENDVSFETQTKMNPVSLMSLCNTFNKSNKNIFGSIASAAAATTTTTTGSGALVTTAGGYALAPATITLIANAPLAAFAFVQASGLSPIKQIVSEKKTGELSPFPFVSLYTNCAIWTLYGLLGNDQTIIVANAAGVVFGLLYTGIFAKYTHISMMKYYTGSFGLMAALLSSPYWIGSTENAMQLLGSFGCASAIILMASPLAVVSTVIKNQSVDAMPFAVSLAMTLNGAAWGTYGWMVAGDVYIWLPNALGTVAGVIQLGLHAKYGGRKG